MNNHKSGNRKCDICSVNFVTYHEELEHEFSLMHHIRLDERKQKSKSPSHTCSLCKLIMPSLKCYVNHLEGKKHKTYLARFRENDKEIIERIKKEKKKILKTNYSKQRMNVVKTPCKNTKQKLKNENVMRNSVATIPSLKSTYKETEKYTSAFPKLYNEQEYNKSADWNYYNNDYFSNDNYDFMTEGNFFTNEQQTNDDFQNSSAETENWDYQSWNTRYCYQQWNGTSPNMYDWTQCSSNAKYYNKSVRTKFNTYNDDSNNKINNNNNNNSLENYYDQREIRYKKWGSQNKCNLPVNKYKYVNPAVKINKSGFEKKKNSTTENKEKFTGRVRVKGLFPKETLMNTNSKKSNTRAFNFSASSLNKNFENSGRKVKKFEKESLQSFHVRFNDINNDNDHDHDHDQANNVIANSNSENSLINKSNKENKTKTEILNDKYDKKNDNEYSVTVNENKFTSEIKDTDKVNKTLFTDNDNFTTKKSNAEQKIGEDAQESTLNNEQDISRCNTKLYKLSQLIEKSDIEISANNKELINRLVNFPRSRKEQIRLEQWIKQHIKTKKRLTLPRFNLQFGPSETSKERTDSSILHSMVSEVVNSLPEKVLSSVVSALKNCETDNLEQSTQNDDSKTVIDKKSSSLKQNISSESVNNSELTYNDKLQWLENWITYNLPMTEENITTPKVEVFPSENIFDQNNENTTENDSGQNDNHIKKNKHSNKDHKVEDICTVKIKTEKDSDEESDITVQLENETETTSQQENDENVVSFSKIHNSETVSPLKTNPESTYSNEGLVNLSIDQHVILNNKIKVEPTDIDEMQILDSNNMNNNLDNFQNNNINIDKNFTSMPQMVETNLFSNHSLSDCYSSSINEMINTENMPCTNELSEQRKLESLNATNIIHSSTELRPGSSSSQTLIQDMLAISQKEENLRILGQKIDQNIIYLMKLIEERKKKRAEIYQEEAQLRSVRIQLLHKLQGIQNNQEAFHTETKLNYPENNSSFVNKCALPEFENFPDISHATTLSDSNELGIFPFNLDETIVYPNSANLENQRIEKPNDDDKIKLRDSDKISKNKAKKTEISRKRTHSAESLDNSLDKRKKLKNNINKKKELTAKKLKLDENVITTETQANFAKILTENHSESTVNNHMKNEQFSLTGKENIEKSNSIYEKTNEICRKDSDVEESSENKTSALLYEKENIAVDKLEAHNSPIVDLKVQDGYLYTCSSDMTAKKFDLKNPTNVMSFTGHQKTVTSIHIIKLEGQKEVFTASLDGCLRCFNDQTGSCLQTVELQTPILCIAEGWGKLYLGLHSGRVSIYSLITRKVVDFIQCSTSAISCISTAAEGAQRILCIASYDKAMTVWDVQSGLLLRCLEGQIKPPCSVKISGNIVYTSTTERTCLIHNLSSGKLQKVLNWPSSATGLYVMPKFILSCSFDGLVRCYAKEKWMLYSMYYGAGKSSVLCMDIYKDWVFTGNRNGIIEAFKFNPQYVVPCQFGKCYFRFGRIEDLKYHIKNDHILNINSKLKTCAWRGCEEEFLSLSDEEKRNHILHHMKNNCTPLLELESFS